MSQPQTDQTRTSRALALRGVEALPQDVGRGVVRLDPADIERLGASVGDVVQIVARRTTVARVMPAYVEQRGQSLLQMDGILRTNAGAGLDDAVSVERVEAQQAR